MNPMPRRARTRRKFLQMLGVSPLIASSSVLAGGLADLLRAEPLQEEHFLGWLGTLQQQDDAIISAPDQALDVMEDLGLLIGHHGQTIDAIQHLAYRIAFRRCQAPLQTQHFVERGWWKCRRTDCPDILQA